MKIQFVNHASFIIEHENVKLICDPWISGPAFNKGWKLLSETKLSINDFNGITHIWFSHEHPDHFSPPNLLEIPKSIRENITVLFQKTTDEKVLNFCNKIGFKEIIELEENKTQELTKNFKILCNPYTEGDSYALFTVNNIKILNLNDCVVNTDEKALLLKKKIGEVDLLFTQFGYANKIGNQNDVSLRKIASSEKLERIFYQNKHLKPNIIIPFASFVYFSHEENKYMNDGINKIDVVYSYISNDLKTKCIVMYPNDIWEIGQEINSNRAIDEYLKDYDKINSKKFEESDIVDEKELISNCNQFIKTIKEGYKDKINTINSLKTNIYISDYNQLYTLSGKYGLVINTMKKEYDVFISSESLNYCFKELWGFDTLLINGRFQIYNNHIDFYKFGNISSFLNRKEGFPIPNFKLKVIKKLKRFLGFKFKK
jgi:UDP-MurNAc hydroxylase